VRCLWRLRVVERPRLHPVPFDPGDSELRPDAPNMPVVTFQQSRYSFRMP
jgi:hypothetical protein